MKAICLRARGGPEALAYEEAPQPHPGEGAVLVRVHAAGVIHTELSWVPTWTTRAGEPRPLPVIPGHEFSGEIAALGAGVRDVGVGDLVYGLNDWYRDGASAEYCVARVADIAHKPAGVDHVHAAATPISALTAWQGLVERAGLAAGQRVLIHGAGGGSPQDPLSHTINSRIRKSQQDNRIALKSVMERNGFKNLEEEWWHFTLKNEPYPDKYFDFKVE